MARLGFSGLLVCVWLGTLVNALYEKNPANSNRMSGSPQDSATNPPAGSCGQSTLKRSFQRIVGGTDARPHSIPWIVSLRKWKKHFCGGTLIRVSEKMDESDIILTAAHCMTNYTNFEIVAGAHYRNRQEVGEESVSAEKVLVHPEYKKPTYDIAIVKLSKPIIFSPTIQPACLPAQGEKIADGVNGIVAGWGGTREGGPGSDTLQQVIIPSISTQRCKQMYPQMNPEIMFCGGFEQGQKDACQGDSGGPYAFENERGFTLHGVVSWGSGCGRPGTPGVYARVSTFVDWIKENAKALSDITA